MPIILRSILSDFVIVFHLTTGITDRRLTTTFECNQTVSDGGLGAQAASMTERLKPDGSAGAVAGGGSCGSHG